MLLDRLTSIAGGVNSQPGIFTGGYDAGTRVLTYWIRNRMVQDQPSSISFGYNEGGFPIKIALGGKSVITRNQIAKAESEGAVLLYVGQNKSLSVFVKRFIDGAFAPDTQSRDVDGGNASTSVFLIDFDGGLSA